MVDRLAAPADIDQGGDQIAAEAAADAAAGNADQIVVARLDQVGVDRQRAELVDQNRQPAAGGISQQGIDQRRLAGAEIAADQRHRNGRGHIAGRGEDAAAGNGAPDANVLQMLAADLGRVVLEHGKVGVLAAFDRTDLAVEAERIGGAERDRPQRIGDRNPFLASQRASAGRSGD